MAGLVREAVAESYMALGFSRLEVSELVWHMRRPGTPYCCDPSTGFHAVVTMALTCASVDLYGFSGTTTIDGHGVTDGPPGYVGHGIEKEHELLHRMIDHSLPASDYPEATRSSWALTNVRLPHEVERRSHPLLVPIRAGRLALNYRALIAFYCRRVGFFLRYPLPCTVFVAFAAVSPARAKAFFLPGGQPQDGSPLKYGTPPSAIASQLGDR
eukprot:1057492-Prymnesium_polylepis.1